MNKKTMRAISATAALLMLPAAGAAGLAGDEWYLGTGYALFDYSDAGIGSANGYKAFGGYRHGSGFGLELALFRGDELTLRPYDEQIDTQGLSVAAQYYLRDALLGSSSAGGFVKLGLYAAETRSSLPAVGESRGSGALLGAGFDYSFTPRLSLRAEFEHLPSLPDTERDRGLNLWSVGAELRFP